MNRCMIAVDNQIKRFENVQKELRFYVRNHDGSPHETAIAKQILAGIDQHLNCLYNLSWASLNGSGTAEAVLSLSIDPYQLWEKIDENRH